MSQDSIRRCKMIDLWLRSLPLSVLLAKHAYLPNSIKFGEEVTVAIALAQRYSYPACMVGSDTLKWAFKVISLCQSCPKELAINHLSLWWKISPFQIPIKSPNVAVFLFYTARTFGRRSLGKILFQRHIFLRPFYSRSSKAIHSST